MNSDMMMQGDGVVEGEGGGGGVEIGGEVVTGVQRNTSSRSLSRFGNFMKDKLPKL